MDYFQEICSLLKEQAKKDVTKILTVPPDSKMGDFALPCFVFGKNPHEQAEKLQKKLKLPKFIAKTEVAGPYLNLFLNPTIFAETTLLEIYKNAKHYGGAQLNKSSKIVVEYCGPNTNKPLHLGHLRNMALGNTICRILEFYGHKVIPVNIINDRGVHICKSMLAYQKWGKNKKPNKKGDHFVGDFYVKYSQEEKKNPELKEEIQQLLVKWENGDKETLELWEKMNCWVLEGFAETYKRFGISFQKEYFESKYYARGRDLVEAGVKKKVFKKEENGSIIAQLEKKYNLPDKVLLRADGTSIYITQDMYLANMRFRDFKFNKMIYVVGSEQNLHFKQLFTVLKMLKEPYAEDMYHLSYGMVHLPSGRMKSREGTVVDADDIIDETAKISAKEIVKRHPKLLEKEVKERSDVISLAAIKFYMVRTDANRDITFNPEESLNFEGETGPYVQYTHARICSILRKAKKEHQQQVISKVDFSLLNLEEEKTIITHLYNFPEAVEKAANSLKPHYIANYLISLSQAFNEFYHKCPVLSEVKAQVKVRLLLVDSVRQVLVNGLNLLGIEAPEEM